jgi:nucleoside-diphosphate-sugar epimerase
VSPSYQHVCHTHAGTNHIIGILGREIVFELGKDTKTWPTVYALSRSKKEDYPSNVKHTHIDLQEDPKEMAKELEHVDAEYVFFTAYLAQDDEDDATKVNGDMLQNFITALKLTGAAKNIKRFILTTGGKQYGVHFGRPKNPMSESDHWLTNPSYPSKKQKRSVSNGQSPTPTTSSVSPKETS